MTSPLSPEEIERYARHIVLHGVGGPGQQKLKAARVLVIGAGGLGSPLIQYLAAAGVGEIGVVDDDTVSLSNLQRQVLHGAADIGRLQGPTRIGEDEEIWAAGRMIEVIVGRHVAPAPDAHVRIDVLEAFKGRFQCRAFAVDLEEWMR